MRIFESFDEYCNHQSNLDYATIEASDTNSNNVFEIDWNDIDQLNAIDEGAISRLAGGMVGVTLGRFLMKKILTGLGVDNNSTLYKVLTSRIVTFAVGSAFKRK